MKTNYEKYADFKKIENSDDLDSKSIVAVEAPINLTWIVLFTGFMCAASLIVDDIFFRSQRRHLLDYDETFLTLNLDSDDLQDDDFLSVIITSSSFKEKHAAVHGGACCALFGILCIWCVSAYITVMRPFRMCEQRQTEAAYQV